jgi:hypothetical protein
VVASCDASDASDACTVTETKPAESVSTDSTLQFDAPLRDMLPHKASRSICCAYGEETSLSLIELSAMTSSTSESVVAIIELKHSS